MDRTEAIEKIARVIVEGFPNKVRIENLETITLEDWSDVPEWANLSEADVEKLESDEYDPLDPKFTPLLEMQVKYGLVGYTNEHLASMLRQYGIQEVEVTGSGPDLESCPCCGYRTLRSRGNYEICHVCWWEDDGQDNETADRVLGGPNGNHSLSSARANFILSGISCPEREDLRESQDQASCYARGRFFSIDEDNVIEVPAT